MNILANFFGGAPDQWGMGYGVSPSAPKDID